LIITHLKPSLIIIKKYLIVNLLSAKMSKEL